MPGDAAYSCGAVSGGGEVRFLSVYGCRGVLYRQRFCDFAVDNNLFFFLRRKKKREKERPLRGLRREVSPDLLRRTEIKLKSGAQCGSAPRDPPGNGQAGRDKQQRCCAQRKKFLYSGQNVFVRRAARHDPNLGFPLRAAKQGRGIELVPSGNQDPQFRLRNCY